MSCNRPLYRLRRMFAAVQSVCGSPAILGLTDGKLRQKVGQVQDPQMEMNERDVARETLTPLPDVPGLLRCQTTVSWQIVGSGSLSDLPECDQYLRGCGMQPIALAILNLSGIDITKKPARGDQVTSAGTGVARVVNPMQNYDTFLIVEILSGTFLDTEVITGPAGVVGTMSGASADGGFSYKPRSTGYEFLTLMSEEHSPSELDPDQKYSKQMYDALGTMTMTLNAGAVGEMEFTFQGVVNEDARFIPIGNYTGDFASITVGALLTSGSKIGELLRAPVDAADGEMYYRPVSGGEFADTDVITLTDEGGATASATATANGHKMYDNYGIDGKVTTYTTNPKKLKKANFVVDGHKPRFNAITFDAGNDVSVPVDHNSETSLAMANIGSRAPQGTVDPEFPTAAQWDVYNKWFKGDLYSVEAQSGLELGNRVFVYVDNAQSNPVADGERDGATIANTTFMAKGQDNLEDDEYEIVFA